MQRGRRTTDLLVAEWRGLGTRGEWRERRWLCLGETGERVVLGRMVALGEVGASVPSTESVAVPVWGCIGYF